MGNPSRDTKAAYTEAPYALTTSGLLAFDVKGNKDAFGASVKHTMHSESVSVEAAEKTSEMRAWYTNPGQAHQEMLRQLFSLSEKRKK